MDFARNAHQTGTWRSFRRAFNWVRWLFQPAAEFECRNDGCPCCCYEDDED